MSIVTTAASGQLGRLVVSELLRRGVAPDDIVAGARSLDSVKDLAEVGVRTAVLDYDRPDTVAATVRQGDTLVLTSGNDLANRDRQHADVIAVAGKAGVAHLVYTSGLRATDSRSPIAASHVDTEDVGP
jgi:NAD(P)H dehydrogenase (quinone)